MEEQNDGSVTINPVVRLLGVLLLAGLAFASYHAAATGDIGNLIGFLAFFLFLAPPVIAGKLPRFLKTLPGELSNLNEKPFKLHTGESQTGFWIALVVAFLVSVLTVLLLMD